MNSKESKRKEELLSEIEKLISYGENDSQTIDFRFNDKGDLRTFGNEFDKTFVPPLIEIKDTRRHGYTTLCYSRFVFALAFARHTADYKRTCSQVKKLCESIEVFVIYDDERIPSSSRKMNRLSP